MSASIACFTLALHSKHLYYIVVFGSGVPYLKVGIKKVETVPFEASLVFFKRGI
jgi:hypothetical protein